MKDMLKLGLALALYAAVACVGLALVYTATTETIKGHAQRNLDAALKEIFPQADDFTDISKTIKNSGEGIVFSAAYKIFQDGDLAGVAIQASGQGYGGTITLLAGIDTAGIVRGVKILEHKESPGLGANIASPRYYVDKVNKITFTGQFAGKSVNDPFEAKNDVEAITASTVSSRAVSNIVKAAAQASAGFMEGGL
ncbi:hypothetical protein FACS1894147_01540 [Spirochaetia bacterium]|nr:hypothetical protein FACS1894147_01540 [Spirochaetia bacterium]